MIKLTFKAYKKSRERYQNSSEEKKEKAPICS